MAGVGQTPPEAAGGNIPPFKEQPWTLFDTVQARSFLLGDNSDDGLAQGTRNPAINAAGEMIFFSAGRNKANNPWLTNMDQSEQLAFGMEVWQVYLILKLPVMDNEANNNNPGSGPYSASPMVRLAECLLNHSILQLVLGQEDQWEWPTHRFGAGGGLSGATVGGTVGSQANVQNGLEVSVNVLKLPEAIKMPRTQPIAARLRIDPDVYSLIGTPALPGVGTPLLDYLYDIYPDFMGPPIQKELPMPPFAVELGLQGKRVKLTQYGQTVEG